MIVADTHLHFYDCYDLSAALRGCVSRLAALAGSASCVGILAERSGQHVFSSLVDGSQTIPGEPAIHLFEGGHCLRMQFPVLKPLYLFPGRQIVTSERLELLCLCVDAEIPDGLAADETVRRIREVGGVAVLTWAVGKWLFKRAGVVRSLLDEFKPSELLLGDSAMRPIFWPLPGPMRIARQQGRGILAGTDPLPAVTEISVMGSYASLIDYELDEKAPSESMRMALEGAAVGYELAGKRSGVLKFVQRMVNSRAKP
jgi:hypothetical protein